MGSAPSHVQRDQGRSTVSKGRKAGTVIRMGATHNEVTLPGGTVHDLGAMRDDGEKLDRSMAIREVCAASGIRDKKGARRK